MADYKEFDTVKEALEELGDVVKCRCGEAFKVQQNTTEALAAI